MAYIKVHCGPACQSCEQLEFSKRCPFDANTAKNAFEPGDVDKFFERITTDQKFAKYNVTIHSRPKKPEDVDGFVDGPWLLTLDNFVSVSCQSIADACIYVCQLYLSNIKNDGTNRKRKLSDSLNLEDWKNTKDLLTSDLFKLMAHLLN